MQYRKTVLFIRISALILAGLFILGLSAQSTQATTRIHSRLKIVAAENFWGSLAQQIGGNKAAVVSLVKDPNADPHEYESSTATAVEVSDADYVIYNGAGYDSWANKLLASGGYEDRKVLDVAKLLGKKNGDNPHFWYSPEYVDKVALQIKNDLTRIDPPDSRYFASRYIKLRQSLKIYQDKLASINVQFKGTKVAATEDIFSYMAKAAGLDLISPPAFITSVAEGNEPPTASVVQFQSQLTSNQPRLLVYNKQTVTPLTDSMKSLALKNGIPIVGITETIQPPNASFQDWMNAQTTILQKTLEAEK